MVLQTSCRCLRQVIKNSQETALIYLNESNAEKLNMQLERQHHISLKEFSSADNSKTTLKQNVVENIMADDKGKLKVDKKTQQLIDLAMETGNDRIVLELQQRVSSHPNKNRSFHYLPYRTDSGFEQTFLKEVLSFDIIEELGLEVYYNGDRAMTEFKIKCYKKTSGKWNYIGIYTPDFLIIKRKDDVIHKVIVVETKGQIYAKDPVFNDKKNFMETEFSKQNNAAYGYERFDYLYLEDTMPEKDRMTQTHKKICEFFKEKA